MREGLSPLISANLACNAALYAYNLDVSEALAAPALIQTLEKDEREDVRRAAAEALGSIGPVTTEAISALVHALDDNSDYVRWAAAKALDAFTRQGVSVKASN
jgi:hypothetical protein